MKRYVIMALMTLMLFASPAFANGTGRSPQAREKSEAEKYTQQVSRIKSDEIGYAYISASMFRQMFGMMGADVEFQGMTNPFGSIKSMRRFIATGENGYELLYKAMKPFLQEDETVMGMSLMALNREDGILSVIYSDSRDILVINVAGGDDIAVVFVAGLSYDAFMMMREGGRGLDFGF